ncbi:MAG: hypothetical protein AAFZ92_10870, partial [Pseudomonadota bacterium]
MKRNNIRHLIAAKTLPWLVMLLFFAGILMFFIAFQYVNGQLVKDHQKNIDEFARNLNDEIASFEQQIANIAKNDLIINGLIDAEDRQNYIPLFVKSFSLPNIDQFDF